MKTILLITLLAFNAIADETIHMSNGMVCYKDSRTGEIYGCSGGDSRNGFTDDDGTYYDSRDGIAVDPNTGESFQVDEYKDDDYYE